MGFDSFVVNLGEKDYTVILNLNDRFLLSDEDGNMKLISAQELTESYKFQGFLDSDEDEEEEIEEESDNISEV